MTNKKIALVLVSLLTLFLTACTQKASDPKQDNWINIKSRGPLLLVLTIPLYPWVLKKRMANIQALILT